MAWRPAYSLQTLRNQLDAAYPGWTFLGFLGDQAHASVASDHNPNSAGVVCALDIGPGGGLDIHALANNIVAKPHPNLKYIISNRRIANWQTGFRWEYYGGSDPHGTHIHVSVGRGSDGRSVQPYDDTIKWNIGKGDTDMATKEQLQLVYEMAFPMEQVNTTWVNKWAGQDMNLALQDIYGDKSRQSFAGNLVEAARAVAGLRAKVAELSAGQSVTQAEIDALAKQADNLEQAIKAVNK